MMQIIVSKFGGTSMATAENIRTVAHILQSDARRSVCVVSAPGKTATERKMTDLLMQAHIEACTNRAAQLVQTLELGNGAMCVISAKLFDLSKYQTQEALVSFGEWLSAYLLSRVTGRRLIDACEVISFDHNQVRVTLPWDTGEQVIVPGFYGYDSCTGNIKLFPRGGSDITASHIAKAIRANLCENWTDVPGVFDKDPNRYSDATPYPRLCYTELLEVAQAGAQVFHLEAIAPLRQGDIPLHIKSTFAPHEPGTVVTSRSP